MAWSSAELSANEIAWAAADKPMISANAYKRRINAGGEKWVVGKINGTVADANGEDTTYVTENLIDGYPGRLSKPNAADTAFTIVVNNPNDPMEFDWVGILNHNLDTLACTAFTVEVGNNGLFTATSTISSTNLATALSSDRRWANLELYHTGSVARRYTGVQYLRIAITCSSGTPEIGQLILGRRRQQQFQPQAPWDPNAEASSMDDFIGRDGMLSRQSRFKARRSIVADWRHSLAALQSDVLSWWGEIDEGGLPFYYHDEPESSPKDFYMMMLDDPELQYPWSTSVTRDFNLRAIEQGPSFFSLE